jgi:hypothetical protein
VFFDFQPTEAWEQEGAETAEKGLWTAREMCGDARGRLDTVHRNPWGYRIRLCSLYFLLFKHFRNSWLTPAGSLPVRIKVPLVGEGAVTWSRQAFLLLIVDFDGRTHKK